jgi:hypothetical protein
MGWYGIRKESNEKLKDVLINELFSPSDRNKFELMAISMVGNTAYLATKIISTGKVFASVVITKTDNSSYNNLWYKEMDETAGPHYYDCPQKILKMLTPTDSEYANEWRKECWKNIFEKANTPKVQKIEDGMKIKFKEPLKFVNGHVLDTFIVSKYGRTVEFHNGYNKYIIRKWRKLPFEIVG